MTHDYGQADSTKDFPTRKFMVKKITRSARSDRVGNNHRHENPNGLEKGLRKCRTAAKSAFRFVLLINIFLLLPVLFIEYMPSAKPPVFRDGTVVPSFLYALVPYLLSRGPGPVAKSTAGTS
jgi:hypothetical protein